MFRGIYWESPLGSTGRLWKNRVWTRPIFYTLEPGWFLRNSLQLYGRKFIYLRVQYYVGFVASRKDQQDRQSVQPNKIRLSL
jgi:hypothetical protein